MCSTLTYFTINVPQMYSLSFYLNNILHVSLQNTYLLTYSMEQSPS